MLRPSYRGELAPPLYRDRTLLLALLLVPVPVLLLVGTRRPRRRTRAATPAVTLRALARREATVADARALRRAFLAAAAARLDAPATVLAEPATFRHLAIRAGVTASTADRAHEFIAELNGAAFDVDARIVDDGVARAYDLYRVMDREARPRRAARAPAAIAGVLLLAAVTLHAADMGTSLFASGVSAYAHGEYASAVHDFGALAAREPRAPDAWANLGTAAFAAGDTARAMVGWQRALRLEPLAADVRDRIDLLSPGGPTSPGFVPAMPVAPLAWFAALLWLAGWLSLAWQGRKRGASAVPLRTGVPIVLTLAALFAASAVVALDYRINASNVAVIAHDVPLRLLPALAADRGATLRTGDVAWVVEEQGAWALVSADGGRSGWMDASALDPIPHD
jgi:tetratricopeptide (TPR) repeat protein